MRRARPSKEPATFDRTVRQKGSALAKKLKKTYPKGGVPEAAYKGHCHWTACLDALAAAFGQVCAYSCIRIDPVTGARTVDHFVPKSVAPELAYEWTNYRYAASRMNSRKGEHVVCDPFKVKPGWFEMDLMTCELHVGTTVKSPKVRKLIENTIERLGLNRDVRIAREECLNRFLKHKNRAAWQALLRECPLVAEEYQRQTGRSY